MILRGPNDYTHIFTLWAFIAQLQRRSVPHGFLAGIILCNLCASSRYFLCIPITHQKSLRIDFPIAGTCVTQKNCFRIICVIIVDLIVVSTWYCVLMILGCCLSLCFAGAWSISHRRSHCRHFTLNQVGHEGLQPHFSHIRRHLAKAMRPNGKARRSCFRQNPSQQNFRTAQSWRNLDFQPTDSAAKIMANKSESLSRLFVQGGQEIAAKSSWHFPQ